MALPDDAPKSSAQFSARRFGAAFYKASYRLRRLRSAFYPVIHPLTVDFNISRIAARIIITNRFDEATVALRTLLGNDDSIKGLFLCAPPSQPDRKQNAPPCSLTEINQFEIQSLLAQLSFIQIKTIEQ
jgi:hypothetical protein